MTKNKGHIVSLIDGNFYDITGAIEGDFIPASDEVMEALTNRKFDINDCSYFVPEWYIEDDYIQPIAANEC